MRKRKSYISFVMSLVLLFGILPSTAAVYAAGSDVRIDTEKAIDVVLSLGQSDQDISSFEADLNAKLQALGIPRDKVKITSVEASQVSAGNTTGGWLTYDHITSGWNYTDITYTQSIPRPEGSSETGPYKHIWTYSEGQKIIFYGYESPAYRDFMYMPNESSTKKTFTFTMDDANINNHSMKGGGFLFNAKISNESSYALQNSPANLGSIVDSAALSSQTISGYVLLLEKADDGKSYPVLYQVKNMTLADFHNNAGTLTELKRETTALSGVHQIKIEIAGTSFKMWDTVGGTTNTMEYTLPDDFGMYGFGPIADYNPHGCTALSWFNFENLHMEMTSVKKFIQVLREPEWRDGADKFVVNLNDETVDDFDDGQALGEILTRMGNEQMHYIGWGLDDADDEDDLTADQAQTFIAQNDDRGTFINRDGSNYEDQIEAIAQYILDEHNKSKKSDIVKIPAGSPVVIDATPSAEETNGTGKWKIDYHSSVSEATYAPYVPYDGLPLDDLNVSLDEPGTYDIYYDNILVKTVEVYQPVVSRFDVQMELDEDDTTYLLTLNNESYDPVTGQPVSDDKVQWRYKNTSDTDWSDWSDDKPTTLAAGENYLIELRSQDDNGEWGQPYSRYVSTSSNDADAPAPIADFYLTPKTLNLHNGAKVKVVNTSYDPTGNNLTASEFTITKDGQTVTGITYNAIDSTFNFTGQPAGKYVISLKVNVGSNESAIYRRTVTVIDDRIDPTVASDHPSGTYYVPEPISLTFDDEGDSGFGYQQYALTDTTDAPQDDQWSGLSGNAARQVKLKEAGTWYLHYKAIDNSGNTVTGYFGPYEAFKLTNTKSAATGQTVEFGVSDFVYGYPGGESSLDHIIITMLPDPGQGTLKFEDRELSVTDIVYKSDLDKISFVPTPGWHGLTSFKWKGHDGTSATNFEIETVLQINTAPVVIDTTKQGTTGRIVSFSPSDFTVNDLDEDTLIRIKIVTLPEHGTLKLDGTAVLLGQEISMSEIRTLTFEPEQRWTGSTSFKWVGFDGLEYSQAEAEMAIRVSAPPSNEPTKEEISVDVDAGKGESISKAKIIRTTEPNGTVKDEVLFTPENAAEAVSNLTTQGSDTARIVIPDTNDKVSETKVTVPKDALKLLAEGQKNLEIFTANGRIVIPYSSFAALGEDLYFRIVPIKKESEKDEVIRRVKQEEMVKEIAQNDSVRILGRPMTIETNMESQPVKISFPLYDRLPEDQKERDNLLKNLVIFVEHDDGTKELVKGTLTNYATADDMGVEFDISKFSTFTMVYMEGWEAYLASLNGETESGSHKAYVSGYPDGTFGPDKPLTRAEVAALLARNLKDQSPAGTPIAFGDLQSKHWAYANIQQVVQRGLMKGYPDGNFYPNRVITRAEMATIAYMWKGLKDKQPSVFKDTSKHWAEGMIGALNQAGIMDGYPDGTFKPEQGLTRAEGVHLFNRLLERGPLKGVTTASWPDVSAKYWAFEDIEEASRDHDYNLKDDEEFLADGNTGAQ